MMKISVKLTGCMHRLVVVNVMNNNNVCYICLDEESDTNPFKNPLPCLCKGTTMIHRKCFIDVRKNTDKCPNCKSKYTGGVFTIDCPVGMKVVSELMGNSGFRMEYIVDGKGVRNGKCQLVFQDLYMSYECTYKDGKMHGLFTKYYPSGYINYTCDHANGKKNGVERIYYIENDAVHKEIEYKDDIKHGYYREYSMEGRLLLDYSMNNGKKHGRYRMWHESSGFLIIDMYYEYDKYHGSYKRYYSNGVLEIDTVYRNHKYEGYYRKYYKDGTLECECWYRNGLMNGEYRSYKMNGELQTTVLYGSPLVT